MFTDEEHKEGTVQPECEAVKNIGLMMGRDGSPTPQFKSINSVVLSFLYGPSLTPIHDYWEKHRFDYMDISWQSDVCIF